MKSKKTRCGSIVFLGRPNVGKSTLLNKILGKKLSITSPKPQTTRSQIVGIKTVKSIQWIYIDTPGLHQNVQRGLNRRMIKETIGALSNVDVIGFIVEANRWTEEDQLILSRLKEEIRPVLLIVNKVDKVKDKSCLLPYIKACNEKLAFRSIVPTSAKEGHNIEVLEKVIADLLPISDFLYPRGHVTAQDPSFLSAEFIREKLMRYLHKELPFWLTVRISQFEEQKKIVRVTADIWVERTSHKAIVIGAKGSVLKKVGTEARWDMEAYFSKKVYLNLWVKVKPGWSEKE